MACQSLRDYVISSTLGTMKITSCCRGLHSLTIVKDSKEMDIDKNFNIPAKLIDEDGIYNSVISETLKWLNIYFCHPSQLENIGLPPICSLVMPKKGSFTEAVWKAMAEKVTFGNTISYQKLAEIAGHPGASRAVGSVMRKNNMLLFIPCHRVIRSDGKTGNFSAGDKYKKFLLDHESSKST